MAMKNLESYRDFILENEFEETSHPIDIFDTLGKKIATVNAKSLAGLDLSGVDFSYADLENKYMKETKFEEAILFHCKLNGADLTGADLTKTDLELSSLGRTQLDGANFSNAHMDNSSLSYSKGNSVNFEHASMNHVTIYFAKIKNSSFVKSELRNGLFTNNDLEGCDFSQANTYFANFSGCNLKNAKGLETCEHIDKVCFVNSDLTGVDISFFERIIESENLQFAGKDGKVRQKLSLQEFFEGCEGVPWDKMGRSIKSKNLFGI